MKSILGFIVLFAVALTGGLYVTMRPADKKVSDRQYLTSLVTGFVDGWKDVGKKVGHYFQSLFSTNADQAPTSTNVA